MKRLWLFVLISAVIGGGIWWLSREKADITIDELTGSTGKVSEPEFFIPSEELVLDVINKVLPDQFAKSSATYTVADLNHQEGPELIIGTIEDISDLSSRPATAAVYVVSLLNTEGEYELLGKLEYTEWLRGIPEVKELIDLDGDGKEEIIMSLLYGGASSSAVGILTLNDSDKRLRWAQFRDQAGKQQDAVFIIGASAVHHNYFETRGNQIIEVLAQRLAGNTAFVCEANVYEWDGNLFSYSKQLSENTLSELGSDCRL